MFDFRIIDTEDGNQVIDRGFKTPYNSLTPSQMMEYMEVDSQLAYMDRMERRARKKTKCKRKIGRNLLWKLACWCGLV